MADVVQYRLERMVDELDDLERRGLFSLAEISEIVKKRRDFEYRLKRPCPIKHDFVSYIDYERQLDALRDLRKKAIIGELKKQKRAAEEFEEEKEEDGGKKRKRKSKSGKLWKRSISDVAGVMRILDIYRKATVRYKGDLDLWFRYLEFCREHGHGRMKQVLVQAIRFHPKVPGLWMYAAAWEFDHNLNVAAARALMQNGLRACPEAEDMWIEYLRMELTYLNKLKARKVALGEDVKTLARNIGNKEMENWKEENKDLFMAFNDEKEEAEELDHNEGALEKKENFFWEQGSNILRTIYHGAIEALPSSISLRKRFSEILDKVDLAHSDELKEDVMEDIRKNFLEDECYWDWLGRYQIRDMGKDSPKEEVLKKLKKAVQVYEDALKILPSAKMFHLYAKFLLGTIVPETPDASFTLHDIGIDAAEFSSCLLKIYERAESCGCLTEDLAHQYISFYLHMGRLEEARALSERLCDGRFSRTANLWVLRVSIEIKWLSKKSASLSTVDFNSIFELLRSALAKAAFSEAEELWLMALKIFSNQKDHFKKFVDSFIVSVAKAGRDSNGYSVSSAIVNQVLQRDGIQHARKMYKRFLALPHPSLAFFKYCIELESNLLVCDGIALLNARKLYESAVNMYGQNRQLWKDYYNMEIKVGTSGTSNAIYWRARKALGDTTGLSEPSYI